MNLKPETVSAIDALIPRYPEKRSAMMMTLHAIQEDQGRISDEAIEWVAKKLEVEPSEVLGVVSIFTYGMQKGLERLAEAQVENHSLCQFDEIARIAAEEGYIQPRDVQRLLQFRDNPNDDTWKGATT